MPDRALQDEPFRAPLLSSEVPFSGTVWDIVRDRFTLGGSELTREFQRHPGAVAVLAEDDQGRVLLIRQYRHPIGFRDWELPAGLLDVAGESALAAAKRELAEEADLKADTWSQLTQFFSSPGGSDESITIFRASGLSSVPAFERSAEESEIEVRWVDFTEVVAAVLDGQLRNAVLAMAVLNAHARN